MNVEISNLVLVHNVLWDFFHVEEENPTNSNIFVNNYIPSLNTNSKALVSFDNNDYDLKGFTETSLGFVYSVYKIKQGEKRMEFVGKVKEGSLSLLDFNVTNDSVYTYYIFKESDDYISTSAQTNSVCTNWWDWSIVGFKKNDEGVYIVDTENMWKFDLNVSSDSITQNMSKSQDVNFTKYPTVSHSDINYRSGGLTAILGRLVDGKYIETIDLKDKWDKFCGNSDLKLLRDRKGNRYIVDIINSSSKIADETKEQYMTTTFGWIEIANADDYQLIGVV